MVPTALSQMPRFPLQPMGSPQHPWKWNTHWGMLRKEPHSWQSGQPCPSEVVTHVPLEILGCKPSPIVCCLRYLISFSWSSLLLFLYCSKQPSRKSFNYAKQLGSGRATWKCSPSHELERGLWIPPLLQQSFSQSLRLCRNLSFLGLSTERSMNQYQLLSSIELYHRMVWVVRDFFKSLLVHPLQWAGTSSTRLLRAPSSLALILSKDGASTASQGNLFLCLTTLIVKNSFLISI